MRHHRIALVFVAAWFAVHRTTMVSGHERLDGDPIAARYPGDKQI